MKRIKTKGVSDSRCSSFHSVKDAKCPEKHLKELKEWGLDQDERHVYEMGYNRAVKDLDESEEDKEKIKKSGVLYEEQLRKHKGKKMLLKGD